MRISSPLRKTSARKPSHFGSKTHASPAGNSLTRLASMGRTGGFTGSCTMPWYRLTALRSDASIKKQGQQTGARMAKQKSLLRGVLAGMAGGLAAAWVMNEFMAGLGQKLQQAAQTAEENPQQDTHSDELKEDATMKAA